MAEQFPYEDIVNMPHHVSKKYPQPTMADRAARFAPLSLIHISFEPDKKKAGGAYVTVTGTVKRIDEYEHLVIMTDGKKINIDDIYNLQSELFYSLGLEE